MRKVKAARSGPPAVSTMCGMKCSSVAGSKYSRFSPGGLLVVAQVEVAPVVDALQLLPAEREAVLDVDRLLGVVRQLVRRMLAEAQPGGRHAVPRVPVPAARQPLLEDARGIVGAHEVLHLHLLELAHPEDEVARADLVAEALADLCDAERQLLAGRLLDVLEVDVGALRGLRPQVDHGRVRLHGSHEGLEHEVEAARRGERAAVHGTLQPQPGDDVGVAHVRLAEVLRARQLVEPEAALVRLALDQRVGERRDVAGRDPDLGMHQDPGVQPHDVVPLLDHDAPPGPLDVVLELDAERAVVPDGVDAAVDLRAGEDEAAPLGERHDRLEVGHGRAGVGRRGQRRPVLRGHGWITGGGHGGWAPLHVGRRWHGRSRRSAILARPPPAVAARLPRVAARLPPADAVRYAAAVRRRLCARCACQSHRLRPAGHEPPRETDLALRCACGDSSGVDSDLPDRLRADVVADGGSTVAHLTGSASLGRSRQAR